MRRRTSIEDGVDTSEVVSTAFRDAMSRFASGVTVVTTVDEAARIVSLASGPGRRVRYLLV